MDYKTKELAKLSGISIRTLHYYDQIGLLSPTKRTEGNYRIYNESDVDMLQQILFLKEMGLKLQQIRVLIKNLNTDKRLKILETHLETLNHELERKKLLIENVKKTIKELKGEKKMTNNEKFEGLKKDLIKQNSIKYKDEVVSNWGEYKYNASIDSIKSMTVETFQKFQKLESDIIEMLIEIKKNYDETLEKKVAQTHQDWIKLAWGVNYTKKLHLEVSDFYIQDERFKHYYEKHGEGLARILRDAIYKYLDN
jgi:MerR family transcriptional regulator, thiopeptide resistance regulator